MKRILLPLLALCCFCCLFGCSIQKTTESKGQYFTFQNITSLQVQNDAGKIILQNGSKFSVNAQNPYANFSCYENNGTLYVKNRYTSRLFGIRRQKDTQIVITLPANTALNSLTVELGAGSLQLCPLSCQNVNIQTSYLYTMTQENGFSR